MRFAEALPLNRDLWAQLPGWQRAAFTAPFYAANSIDDSPLFVANWYPLASFIVAGVSYFVGARLLRW
ncbi:NrsF family protein [Rhizobium sp. SYY.PMSO]|uniref:NrsF family protein n=1 Tax=Rhizobium sp. SYY.PMSO TaxID=3382192 RepID=UPI00398FB4C2